MIKLSKIIKESTFETLYGVKEPIVLGPDILDIAGIMIIAKPFYCNGVKGGHIEDSTMAWIQFLHDFMAYVDRYVSVGWQREATKFYFENLF